MGRAIRPSYQWTAGHALQCFLHYVHHLDPSRPTGAGNESRTWAPRTVRIEGKPGAKRLFLSPHGRSIWVAPVTAGERLVVITFIESQVPDQLQRDLIYTLSEVRALEGLKMDWRNRTQLEYVISNLQRMWSTCARLGFALHPIIRTRINGRCNSRRCNRLADGVNCAGPAAGGPPSPYLSRCSISR